MNRMQRTLHRPPFPLLKGPMYQHTSEGIGWFTLTLINAGLSQGKGRSGLGWWFASLFLGPIATLIIVLLDPEPPRAS